MASWGSPICLPEKSETHIRGHFIHFFGFSISSTEKRTACEPLVFVGRATIDDGDGPVGHGCHEERAGVGGTREEARSLRSRREIRPSTPTRLARSCTLELARALRRPDVSSGLPWPRAPRLWPKGSHCRRPSRGDARRQGQIFDPARFVLSRQAFHLHRHPCRVLLLLPDEELVDVHGTRHGRQ